MPPSRRVPSATSDPLKEKAAASGSRGAAPGTRRSIRWPCSSVRARPSRSTMSTDRCPSNSRGARLAARRSAGYSNRSRGVSASTSAMMTPWVRSWDSTRVPLSSMRYSTVLAINSAGAVPSQSKAGWRLSASTTIVSRSPRRSAGVSAASARAPPAAPARARWAAARSPAPGSTLSISSRGALAGVTSGAMRLRRRTVKVIRQPGGPGPVALAVAGSACCGGAGASSGE